MSEVDLFGQDEWVSLMLANVEVKRKVISYLASNGWKEEEAYYAVSGALCVPYEEWKAVNP